MHGVDAWDYYSLPPFAFIGLCAPHLLPTLLPVSTHLCGPPHIPFQMLATAGIKSMLNELSNTVVFERPKEEAFVRKWQLACEGDIAHVVVMPNVDINKLEEFVQV